MEKSTRTRKKRKGTTRSYKELTDELTHELTQELHKDAQLFQIAGARVSTRSRGET
jgi:hypothetical protein